jgi:hypothetical protein
LSPVDGLDWLDLAAFQLTRVDGFEERGAPATETLKAWRRKQAPPWRRPAVSARRLRELATPTLVNESWVLGSLRRAAAATLVEHAGIWSLPQSWARTTLLRWRLPAGTVHAAAIAAVDLDPPAHRLRPQCDDVLRTDFAEGAADTHVHVGAVLPFDVLFALLIERLLSDPRRLDALASNAFEDSANQSFDPRAALGTAAVITSLLTGFGAAPPGTSFSKVISDAASAEAADAVRAGSTWSYLCGSTSEWSAPRYTAYAEWFALEQAPVRP